MISSNTLSLVPLRDSFLKHSHHARKKPKLVTRRGGAPTKKK